VFTGDFAGWLVEWNPANGDTASFSGTPHSSQITQAVTNGDGKLVTISVDDTIKISSIPHREWAEGIPLGSQPQSVAARKDSVVVGTLESIIVIGGKNILNKLATKYQVAAVAISPSGAEVAAGGSDNNIYLYSFDGSKLNESGKLEGHRGAITSLEYSPDGKFLASTDTNREVKVWQGKTSVIPNGSWVFHNSRVESVAWAPNSKHLATVGNDSQLILWNAEQPDWKQIVKNAHQGVIKGVVWVDQQTLLTAGQDQTMKSWTVKV